MNEQITMDDFTDEVPSEFTDEDKWFIFFTKPMLLVAVIGFVLTVITSNLIKLLFGVFWPFMIIGIILTLMVVVMMIIPAPASSVMKGGGDTILAVILKKIYRRKNRIIYVKGVREVMK